MYSSISDMVVSFYDTDSMAMDWLAMVYLLTHVILVLPVMWMIENILLAAQLKEWDGCCQRRSLFLKTSNAFKICNSC